MSSATYKNPTKNFVMISMATFTENDDASEKTNAIVVQKCITRLRPPRSQSARNPQKNELTTTPMKWQFYL